jgi:hypothetical protein
MGLLGGLFKGGLKLIDDVVTLPVDVVRDVVTPDFDRGSRTGRRLEKVVEDLEEIVDDEG